MAPSAHTEEILWARRRTRLSLRRWPPTAPRRKKPFYRCRDRVVQRNPHTKHAGPISHCLVLLLAPSSGRPGTGNVMPILVRSVPRSPVVLSVIPRAFSYFLGVGSRDPANARILSPFAFGRPGGFLMKRRQLRKNPVVVRTSFFIIRFMDCGRSCSSCPHGPYVYSPHGQYFGYPERATLRRAFLYAVTTRTHRNKKIDRSRIDTLIRLALRITKAAAHGASFAVAHKLIGKL